MKTENIFNIHEDTPSIIVYEKSPQTTEEKHNIKINEYIREEYQDKNRNKFIFYVKEKIQKKYMI